MYLKIVNQGHKYKYYKGEEYEEKIRIISLVSLLLLSIFSTQSVLASESVDDENDNGGYVADDTERLEVPLNMTGIR